MLTHRQTQSDTYRHTLLTQLRAWGAPFGHESDAGCLRATIWWKRHIVNLWCIVCVCDCWWNLLVLAVFFRDRRQSPKAKLQVADEATTEELEAAKAALGQTRTACQQCAAEAAALPFGSWTTCPFMSIHHSCITFSLQFFLLLFRNNHGFLVTSHWIKTWLFEIAGQCSSCKTKRCKICAKLRAIWNTEKNANL